MQITVSKSVLLVGQCGEPLVNQEVNIRGRIFDFYLDFWVWEVSQSIGNCLEIDLDEFSAQEVPYASIFNNVEKFRFCYLKFRDPGVLSGL